ncbi:hypothetical protein IJJ37_03335 [Candidatus Saccharibacteria bacterium]|nr:hypothetical protein [Candidatus Saccharibacteria bacterium]
MAKNLNLIEYQQFTVSPAGQEPSEKSRYLIERFQARHYGGLSLAAASKS